MKKCSTCGSLDNLEFHHIDGQTKRWGGIENDSPSNIVVLCRQCHKEEHSHIYRVTAKYSLRRKTSVLGRVRQRGLSSDVRRNFHEV